MSILPFLRSLSMMIDMSPRVLTALSFFMLCTLGSGFPRLTMRGDCDSIVCPSDLFNDAGAILNGAKDIFNAGVGAAGTLAGTLAGWTINKETGSLEPPESGSANSNLNLFFNPDGTSDHDAIPDLGATTDVGVTVNSDGTPKVESGNADASSPKPAATPGLGIDLVKSPLENDECDSASAPPPLLDLNSNQVSHSFPV